MRKNLIILLSGLLLIVTGCHDEGIRFLEDDVNIDATAQTIRLHTNQRFMEISAHSSKQSNYNGANNTILGPFYTISWNMRRDTITVKIEENEFNLRRYIKICVEGCPSGTFSMGGRDSLTIIQLANESGYQL